MTAKAMQVIYDDEKDHCMVQAGEALSLIENEGDLRRMQEAIRAVSRQRVRMRNEMFGTPMTEDEIEAFIAEHTKAAA